MSNRLAKELSPYLLQHADNPVDWYPWTDEAFERARCEHKPIFLSIGYSTCHWCHVMESESFENEEVACLLNENFVAIKVDREERPDIDRVYMAFVQATTRSGGWPMSVWLTPDLKPFFGGTYFPPTSRWGRPGFTEILSEIIRLWSDNPEKLIKSAGVLMERLQQARQVGFNKEDKAAEVVSGPDTLLQGVKQFEQDFDATHGGFGSAPKFPRPSELFFLLREHVRTGNQKLRDMVIKTLLSMASGGMRDHIGGGFHRYSVDASWRIPHFEKMLYDQSQLVLAFLEVGQLTGDSSFFDVAEDTLTYIMRDLMNNEGGFFSAEDADSLTMNDKKSMVSSKTEGAFYLWTANEIDELLHTEAELFKMRYGISEDGNAPEDPTGEFIGKNQLYLACSLEEVSSRFGQSVLEVEKSLMNARKLLYDVRQSRPRPSLDDKVLTAWNGLMIAALARSAYVFDGERRAVSMLKAAQQGAQFVRSNLWDNERLVLCRRYRDGQASIDGYAEDYAYMVWGLLELFQIDGDVTWLKWAQTLQRRQDELFWDDQHGGWFSTTGTDPSVLLRLKEDYDGAEPSPGSVSLINLQTLAHLTGETDVIDRLVHALKRFGSRLEHFARVVPLSASALSQYHSGTAQIIIVGPKESLATKSLRRVVAKHYLPFAVRVYVEPGDHQDELSRVLPFIGKLKQQDGKSTAYVCSDFKCLAPVTDPEKLASQLASLSSHKSQSPLP